MARPLYQVADVLERNVGSLSEYTVNTWQLRTLHALRKCRTPALGGHMDRCNKPECRQLHPSYNSCRNRHCPKCQGHKREEWIRARERELLDVPYFHVVFTLPDTLNRLCLYAVVHYIVQDRMERFTRFWCQPKVPRGRYGHGRHTAHLGAEPEPAPTSALHRSRRRYYRQRKMEVWKKQGQVPIPGKGNGQGLQGTLRGKSQEGVRPTTVIL